MKKADFLAAAKGDLSETPLLWYVAGGYKYQSRRAAIYQVFIFPPQDIITDLIVLRRDGWLWVSEYFAWDGASGPAWDNRTNMRGSQAHDALFALIRMGLLDPYWIPCANEAMRHIMLRDGAWPPRAKYYRWALDHFAAGAADPDSQRPVLTAP